MGLKFPDTHASASKNVDNPIIKTSALSKSRFRSNHGYIDKIG